MTDIRDLLERATVEAAGHVTDPPIDGIQRAAFRRRLAAGAITIATVIAGAAGVVLTLPQPTGHARSLRTAATNPPSVTAPGTTVRWPAPAHDGQAAGVAVDFGAAWDGGGDYLEQRNPVTGHIERLIFLNANIVDVTVGVGRVWALTTPVAGHVDLVAYDPATGQPATAADLAVDPAAFTGAAFFDGSLWLPGRHDVVLRVTPDGQSLTVQSAPAAHEPQSIANTGRQLWGQEAGNQLTAILPSPGTGTFRFGQTVSWAGPIFGPAPVPDVGSSVPGMLWTTDGSRLIGLAPSLLKTGDSVAQILRLQTHGRPLQAASSARGVFAATATGVDFFSWATVRSGYHPTAHLRILSPTRNSAASRAEGVRGIAADGAGVLIQYGDGTIVDWVPPTHHARH